MGSWEERRAARAELHRPRPARDRARREHETVELEHAAPRWRRRRRALDEELRAEPVAPHHLDGQAADVADLGLARPASQRRSRRIRPGGGSGVTPSGELGRGGGGGCSTPGSTSGRGEVF
jgi:hypothetical protein